MSAFDELMRKPIEERTPLERCITEAAHFRMNRNDDATLMEQAAEDLAEINKNLNVIMCAYCEHITPKSDKRAIRGSLLTPKYFGSNMAV